MLCTLFIVVVDEAEEKKPQTFNDKMLDALALSVATVWTKVAAKLGYAKDEV